MMVKAVMTVARVASVALLGTGLAFAPQAFAQSSSNNPAATINGTVPTAEGNVWGGADHQPTEADVAQGSMQQQQKINRKLQKLDQQLMNDKLPKAPAGAPPVSGSAAQ